MGHQGHDEFFAGLSDLFEKRKGKDHGAIYLVQKRLSHAQPSDPQSEDDPFPDRHPVSPLPILIRATNGKGKRSNSDKIKLSTVVEPDQLDAFYGRYAEVCKAGMAALKPRDRTKRKAKARKKKATT